ncbi:MAG: transposase [Burkholderiales bacterium]|nr:transposase [Burkholderiales bacterium]
MTREKSGTRRRYSKDVKAQVVAECGAPGASVAKVAMAHGINANIVHSWRKQARQDAGAVVSKSADFIAVTVEPVQLPAPAPDATERDIEIELRRGAVTMKITWPVSAAADLAAWTRELLR